MIVFISGGVRSGKSQYAEQLAVKQSKQNHRNLYYIASSHVFDQEMKSRVLKHQQQRATSGANWKVYEQSRDVHELFSFFQEGDVILLDCLTTLLSNELFIGWENNEEKWREEEFVKAIEMKMKQLFIKLASSYYVIVVSNEVTYDLPLRDPSTNVYIKLLNKLHQYIVSISLQAVLVENGLVCVKKGGEES